MSKRMNAVNLHEGSARGVNCYEHKRSERLADSRSGRRRAGLAFFGLLDVMAYQVRDIGIVGLLLEDKIVFRDRA